MREAGDATIEIASAVGYGRADLPRRPRAAACRSRRQRLDEGMAAASPPAARHEEKGARQTPLSGIHREDQSMTAYNVVRFKVKPGKDKEVMDRLEGGAQPAGSAQGRADQDRRPHLLLRRRMGLDEFDRRRPAADDRPARQGAPAPRGPRRRPRRHRPGLRRSRDVAALDVAPRPSSAAPSPRRGGLLFSPRHGCYRAASFPRVPAPGRAFTNPSHRACEAADHAQDQGCQPGRRHRRRRDDPDHLAPDQGEADLPLSRHRPPLFRPRHREPRRDRGQGDGRGGRGDQAGRRRRQVRHDHAGRGAGRGVPPQEDVEVAERHDPQHPRRRHLPRADHLPERAAPGARLDQADRRRPPRLRRPVPRHRLPVPGKGKLTIKFVGDDGTGDRARGLRLPRLGRRDGDVQSRRFDPRFRPRLAQLRPRAEVPGLSLDQEHHPQGL